MFTNIKVTDGDLLHIHVEGNSDQITSSHLERIREKIVKWASKKGLENVEVLVSGGDHKIVITKYSVNDVFEDEVLKGNN